MNAQKRRLKVAEHVREVNRLVAEKRAMYEAARVSRGVQSVQLRMRDCAELRSAWSVQWPALTHL